MSKKLEKHENELKCLNYDHRCRFDANATSNSINRTNIAYGAKNNKVGRIVYIHGTVDPWYSLGIYSYGNRTENNKVIFIKGLFCCF